MEKNTPWIDLLLNRINIILFILNKDIQAILELYGVTKGIISRSGFSKLLHELCPNENTLHIELTGNYFATADKTAISVEKFTSKLKQGATVALTEYQENIMNKIGNYTSYKKLDLKEVMKIHDIYGIGEIPIKYFTMELRNKMSNVLEENEYKFIERKYQGNSGKVNYITFCDDLYDFEKNDEEVKKEEVDIITAKIRIYIHDNDIKVASVLLNEPKPISLSTLSKLFPRECISEEELGKLARALDKSRNKTFNYERLLEELWTDEVEEKNRVNAEMVAKNLYMKIAKYCKERNINLQRIFYDFDECHDGYLSPEIIRTALHGCGLKLSDNQLCMLLYYQKVKVDYRGYKKYADVVDQVNALLPEDKVISERIPIEEVDEIEEIKDESVKEEQKEEDKTIEDMEKNVSMIKEREEIRKDEKEIKGESPVFKQRPVQEAESKAANKKVECTPLEEAHIKYAQTELHRLGDYLDQNNINFKAIMEEETDNISIEPNKLFTILKQYNVELVYEDTMPIIYTYLKHRDREEISLRKLYKEIDKNKIPATDELEKYLKSNEVDMDKFIYICDLDDNRVISKTALKKALNRVNYDYTEDDINEMYNSITRKGGFQGCYPLFLSKLYKNVKGNPEYETKFNELIELIREKLIIKEIYLHQLYAQLDTKLDSYTNRDNFISVLIKIIPELNADDITFVFSYLDKYK